MLREQDASEKLKLLTSPRHGQRPDRCSCSPNKILYTKEAEMKNGYNAQHRVKGQLSQNCIFAHTRLSLSFFFKPLEVLYYFSLDIFFG